MKYINVVNVWKIITEVDDWIQLWKMMIIINSISN